MAASRWTAAVSSVPAPAASWPRRDDDRGASSHVAARRRRRRGGVDGGLRSRLHRLRHQRRGALPAARARHPRARRRVVSPAQRHRLSEQAAAVRLADRPRLVAGRAGQRAHGARALAGGLGRPRARRLRGRARHVRLRRRPLRRPRCRDLAGLRDARAPRHAGHAADAVPQRRPVAGLAAHAWPAARVARALRCDRARVLDEGPGGSAAAADHRRVGARRRAPAAAGAAVTAARTGAARGARGTVAADRRVRACRRLARGDRERPAGLVPPSQPRRRGAVTLEARPDTRAQLAAAWPAWGALILVLAVIGLAAAAAVALSPATRRRSRAFTLACVVAAIAAVGGYRADTHRPTTEEFGRLEAQVQPLAGQGGAVVVWDVADLPLNFYLRRPILEVHTGEALARALDGHAAVAVVGERVVQSAPNPAGVTVLWRATLGSRGVAVLAPDR